MSQDVSLSTGSDEPLPLDAGNDGACCTRAACWMTKTLRAATALLVLGAAGAYGAVSIKPELANYAWFVPESPGAGGTAPVHTSCPLSGGCPASASVGSCPLSASAAVSESGCCSASTGCPLGATAEAATEVAATETKSLTVELVSEESPPAANLSSHPASAAPVAAE